MKKTLFLSLAALACCYMAPADDAGSNTGGTGTGGAPPPPTPSPAPAPAKLTEVRVLVECEHGKPNDVATLSAADLKDAKAAGLVDPDKDAVAYAKTLPQNQSTG